MAHDLISGGGAVLGIELGSTRIKACLIAEDGTTLATGSHDWENQYVDRMWTYSLDDVWAGLQGCYADLQSPTRAAARGAPHVVPGDLGVSAMMHGYLAFDEADELLVPFRTWRNTSTGPAAAELSALFGHNIPLRWSIAHLYQAVLDDEPHVGRVSSLTTLAGYVHWRLTGRKVLGVGDASGMFPIDPATGTTTRACSPSSTSSSRIACPGSGSRTCLPEILRAGSDAGRLTAEGAALLDPSGRCARASPCALPRATPAPAWWRRTRSRLAPANVSRGHEHLRDGGARRPLAQVHDEIDLVTTPAGDPVAMVHCNNGACELGAWAGLFGEFAAALGPDVGRRPRLRGAARPGPGGRGRRRRAAGVQLPVRRADHRARRGPAARRPHPGLAPHAGELHARPAVRGLRDAEPGHARAREGGRALDAMFAHGGLFRTDGRGAAVPRGGHRCARSPWAPPPARAAPGGWPCWRPTSQEAAEVDLATFLDRRIFTDTVVNAWTRTRRRSLPSAPSSSATPRDSPSSVRPQRRCDRGVSEPAKEHTA